jgi:hypothetical protein
MLVEPLELHAQAVQLGFEIVRVNLWLLGLPDVRHQLTEHLSQLPVVAQSRCLVDIVQEELLLGCKVVLDKPRVGKALQR